MNNWLNPDNAFFTFMGKAFDMLVLNVIWLVLCMPVITIVPATTAMYYAVVKVIRRERSYAIKEFFRSFKRNFKQGAVFSVVAVVAIFVMYIDFRYAAMLVEQGESMGSTYLGIFIIVAVLLCSIYAYICPVLSRFDMKLGGLFKTSFLLATRHFPTTVLLLVLMVAVLLGSYILLPGIFFLPVCATLVASFLIERVFKKYMPAKEPTAEGVEGENAEYGEENGQEKDEWYLE